MKFFKGMLGTVISMAVMSGCAQQQKVAQAPSPSTGSGSLLSVPKEQAPSAEPVLSSPKGSSEEVVVGAFVPAGPGDSNIDLGEEPGSTSTAVAQLPPRPLAVGVEEALFCRQIKDRIPQGVATSFDKSVKKVFFFTRITKAKKPTAVTHVWYWKEKKMAEVPLDVRSENWRTWSSKKIDPAWTGAWAVKVLDENGEVVLTKNFEVS